MKNLVLAIVLMLCFSGACFAQTDLLLEDFEGMISGGQEGTIDFGAGNGSSVEVSADPGIKQSGAQSLKVDFNAVPGGYIWVAKKFDLDANNASWQLKPEDIDWQKYGAISFYMYGTDSKQKVAFDLKDNGNELWRFNVIDDFKGWKKVTCKFDEFYVRNDWQSDSADKNGKMDFPIKSFQFEPLPEGKGTLYFDAVALVEK